MAALLTAILCLC